MLRKILRALLGAALFCAKLLATTAAVIELHFHYHAA
jgi:hypothetical protein